MARGKYEKKPEPRAKKAGTGGNKTNKILLRVMIVLLSILLVLLIVAAVAMNYVFGKIGRYDSDSATQTTGEDFVVFETDATEEGQESIDAGDVIWETVDKIEKSEEIINILLIGQDARPGEGRARSDTMILVSLNQKNNTIQMVSFMRDMYVQIPGYLDNRINAAFALGGPELLNATLSTNFGVEVDGNVEVNFEAFTAIIDILGGVDIELDWEETGYMNQNGCSVSEGVNHLDGEAALTYARMRKVSGGDYGRTERQRKVIAAIMTSLKNAKLTDLLNLVNQVLPYVTTDLTDAEIISYATKGLNALSKGAQINSARIPADDAHYGTYINGMSVLVPDLKMCQEDLKELIYGEE